MPGATSSRTPGPGTGQGTAPLRGRVPGWVVGSGVIAVAMGIMNLSTYGFTVLAARWLGPREYGQLAAAMGLLLILGVVALGLQATAARRISAAPAQVHLARHEILTATGRASALVGGVTLLAVPLLAVVLRLDLAVALLVAIAAVPLTIVGGQSGALQGERRWGSLAAVYAAMGLGRLGFGVAALAVDASATSAMAAVAVGAVAPAAVGAVALRRTRPDVGSVAPVSRHHPRSVLGEVLHNSHALLAFFALSNCDILVARAVLDDQASGLYAGGLILTKAVLFLPQFVVVLVFPSMSADTSRRTVQVRALGLILAMGLVTVAVAAVASRLAVVFVGGSAYVELRPDIWAFAVLGTLLAMTQLQVYAVVARQRGPAVLVLWTGLVAVVACSTVIGSLGALLAVMVGVLTCVLVGLAVAGRKPGPGPGSDPDPSSGTRVEA